jgi:signal transduction histidine kinase
MECDPNGRVIWMSSDPRKVLGEPRQFLDITGISALPSTRVWRVWQGRESVVMAVQPPGGEQDFTGGLAAVQSRLTSHFFRLVSAERSLFVRARPKRRSGGRKAIRQMELERRRLGRELHTGAGQALAAIRMQLELIASELPSAPPRVQQALERIGTLAGDTLEQVRSISRTLHPPEWQRLTLEEALRQLWQLSGVAEPFDATLQLEALSTEPDLEVKVLIYRAVQEGLSNLMRHSKANRVVVSLHVVGSRLMLTIDDNGIGFDADRMLHGPVEVGAGIGLRSIREQAEALGGRMSIESGPSGTTLKVSVAVSPVEG